MPPIPTRALKKHPLPTGATWFLSKEEAAARKGIHIEVVTCIAHFHGVYNDLDSLSHHTRNFLNRNPGAETYTQIEEISQMYFEFPQGLRKELGTPLSGRWFVHENAALAAALSASDNHHIASVTLRTPNEEDLTVWGFYPTNDAFVADLARCAASLTHNRCLMVCSTRLAS
jgi:hypothetical protein